jgi:hypothetical protein
MCRQRLGLHEEAVQAYSESTQWLASNQSRISAAWRAEAESLEAEAFIVLGMDEN